MSWREAAGLVVVVATLIGVAVGRYPWLRMNRATIALVGATLLVAMGVMPLEDAFESVDLGTLALLLGMMVLNSTCAWRGSSGWWRNGSRRGRARRGSSWRWWWPRRACCRRCS